jgi:hypothetical protein
MGIKFVAVSRSISSPFSDPEAFVNNLSSDKLAEKLTDRFKENYCENHPSEESLIEVDMHLPSEDWLQLKRYCCDQWREKLDKICKNQDPFTVHTENI